MNQATRNSDIKKQERKEIALAILTGMALAPAFYALIFIVLALQP
jgi:hypothetical protein|tara:strand:+ start:873 stop:1007 length:135 start_codon:yes stop_codon:yes gene_type:complete